MNEIKEHPYKIGKTGTQVFLTGPNGFYVILNNPNDIGSLDLLTNRLNQYERVLNILPEQLEREDDGA